MDALKSYIDVQPIGTNIPKYLEEVFLTQPYVLILGDRPMPSQAVTIFERKALERQSLMSAVDVCFKLFSSWT
ncbi:hypothetical protein HOLleu_21232 [Holothuria leucospilota]|uniref:Uncharacterized protein n=1 Tax=Holothuria leucospilota TaxID=206669 RepID=A0A9Q1H6C2_HOLLE|nr:hypothetical protein HOLleu_21232 [Holothuria leucospilota]